MLLLNKPKKLQLGGSLNQARNENAKVDNAWNKLDTSGFKHAPLDVPDATRGVGTGGRGSAEAGGIPSDIAFANAKLTDARQKLTSKLAGPTSADYQNSMEFKQDSEDVNKWAENLTMLKSMGENYKTTKTKLQKAADDYAMFGGKALVKDSTTGTYSIADIADVLTERVKDDKGTLRNRYTPATVGEALDVRFGDARFSGFNSEGGTLDNILANVIDSESVYKDMDNLFKESGMISEDAGTFVSSKTGEATTLSELIANLEEASAMASQNKDVRSNSQTLGQAVDLFTRDLTPTQIQTLRNKATAQFINIYGNKNVSEAAATNWINNQVDATIAKRASIYLNVATKGKSKAAAAETQDELAKKEVYLNKVAAIQLGGSGDNVTISSGNYKDAEDLKKKIEIVATASSGSVNIKEAVTGTGAKPSSPVLEENQYISTLTGGNVRNNLFLGDDDSTPVASLNKNNGLKTSAVNITSYGQNMKILRGMPYKIENGQYKIAWDKVEEAISAGKEFAKREAEATKKNNGVRLDAEQRAAILKKMDADGVGYTKDPDVKNGDIAMIPIVVYDTDKGFDDKDLDTYMQSGISGEEESLLDLRGFEWLHSGEKKRTFAYSVLPSTYESTTRDYYGPAMELKDKVNLLDFLNSRKSNQALSASGWDALQTMINNASITPETK